jgi:hypothetical protein
VKDAGATQIGPAKLLKAAPTPSPSFRAHGVLVRAFFDAIPKPGAEGGLTASELLERAKSCVPILGEMRAAALARGNIADLRDLQTLETELRLCFSALGAMQPNSSRLVTP